jgi:membrane protease YdiL (CAAX protease family)
MTASIFFTGPKLEPVHQMASNPIQRIEPGNFHPTTLEMMKHIRRQTRALHGFVKNGLIHSRGITILTTASARPSSIPGYSPARHPLASYFLIAFIFSWLMFLAPVLMYYSVIGLSPDVVRLLAIAGLLGPILSGFIMTAFTEKGAGVARLLQRTVRWRVGLRWYAFALLGLPMAMALATFIRPGAVESFDISARPSLLEYLRAFISMVLIGGPLLEEPGWTGFAQPRLQRLYGPLIGGIILGSLWALWHLPGFLIPSQDSTDIPPRGTVFDFVVFTVALTALRLIIVWVVNNTGYSVLMAILTHASWNTFYAVALVHLFHSPIVLRSYLNLTIAACALALLLIAATRGRMGYRKVTDMESYQVAAIPR